MMPPPRYVRYPEVGCFWYALAIILLAWAVDRWLP